MKQAEVQLTAAAIQQFKHKLNESGQQAVRLSLKESGCSGLEYILSYEHEAHSDDLSAEFDGVRIYVAEQFYEQAIKGLHIDYQQDLLSAAFVFNNPNKTGECGCGKSFTA
ncbi:MAG: iron-sulfur cluster assembly accessory protein [Mariprofundaceae bacterium]|nr:iron-sulfur cluster assembly accessory protein [Mariprofundaceae bacterium]